MQPYGSRTVKITYTFQLRFCRYCKFYQLACWKTRYPPEKLLKHQKNLHPIEYFTVRLGMGIVKT